MIHKILPWLAGSAWGGLVFLLGMQLFFPSDAAIERMRYEVDRASDGGWQLNADKAGLWRATGLKLKGVELLKVDKPKRPRRGAEDEEPEAPSATRFLVADHISLRAQILPLLGGSKQASFDADMYQGDLSGVAGLKGDVLGTDGEASELNIGLIPFVGETMSLDLAGRLDATWDLLLDLQDVTKSTGEIELEIEGLVLERATVAGFDLEERGSFDKAELLIVIDDGKAKVKKGELEGDLLDAKLDGDITLNKAFDRSRLRLKAELTLAEHLDNLVKLLPTAKDARRDDGTYHFSISGTIGRPSFRAEHERRTTSRVKRPSTRPDDGPDILPGAIGGAEDEGADAEERRRLREERIRERRERLKERRDAAKAEREVEEPDEFMDDVLDEFEDDEFLDDGPEFLDEMPEPVGRDYDDVELREVPFDEDMLDEFEDDF
jgi:type II secretion system protein N